MLNYQRVTDKTIFFWGGTPCSDQLVGDDQKKNNSTLVYQSNIHIIYIYIIIHSCIHVCIYIDIYIYILHAVYKPTYNWWGGHHLAEIQRNVKAKYFLRTSCDQINFSLSFCKSSVETQWLKFQGGDFCIFLLHIQLEAMIFAASAL